MIKRGTELHYNDALKQIDEKSPSDMLMGVGIAWAYYDDPKHILFTFSRYKFASKILSGKKRLLEIGCGDGFATRVMRQAVENVVAVDVDEKFISDAKMRFSEKWPIDFRIHDIIQDGPIKENFDAVLCLDVMEHLELSDHSILIDNIVASMDKNGALVIGMPSLESQAYASPQSKLGHVSCLTQSDFKRTLEKRFANVFMFSMNDEIVHTGFASMSHYNLALCCQAL